MKRLTKKLIDDSVVVVIAGGNMHALLQSFAKDKGLHEALRTKIQANLTVLMTWSAGATAVGKWTAHSRDRTDMLHHTTDYGTRILRGLELVPDISIAPHAPRPLNQLQQTYVRRMNDHCTLRSGMYAFLPDNTFIVFYGSDKPNDWNSEEIGWLIVP